MTRSVRVEIIGFRDSSCGPFPCSEDRSCGLSACADTERLKDAYAALKDALHTEFGDLVSVTLTLLDDGVPERIQRIIESHHPPLPIVLVNDRVTPVGRISLPLIRKEIARATG